MTASTSTRHHNTEENLPRPRSVWLAPLLSLLLIVCLIVVPPALIRVHPGAVAFDHSHRKQLVSLQPDYVFIGTSPLLSRIDPDHLRLLRPGEKGYLLGEVGSLSALWYLWMKNSLIASKITPKTVFIFFRDTELTNPDDETGSLFNQNKIASNRLPEEPVFDDIIHHNKTLADRLREWLRVVYPIQEAWRKEGFWLIDSIGLLASTPGYLEYQWKRMFHPGQTAPSDADAFFHARTAFKERMATEIFHPGNQRVLKSKNPFQDSPDHRLDFHSRVGHSFLPAMIRLAREASLKLVFIRVERMPNTDGTPITPSASWLAYLSQLTAYLRQEGVGFHDFNNDPAFQGSMYLDEGHIKPEYKKFYTEHFVQKLAEYFR